MASRDNIDNWNEKKDGKLINEHTVKRKIEKQGFTVNTEALKFGELFLHKYS
jgi:hypothetical protein